MEMVNMALDNNGINKVIEECSELITECAKYLTFGNVEHPDGKGNLIERIEHEMADVRAALKVTSELLDLDEDAMYYRQLGKETLYMEWHSENDNEEVN